MDRHFDPRSEPAEKVLVVTGATSAEDELESLKAEIAERVRKDSRERGTLTPADAIEELPGDLRLRLELLNDMAMDERYSDVQGWVSQSGALFLFSSLHVSAETAAEKGHVEEWKAVIAKAVRADSRDRAVLTPAPALQSVLPDVPAEQRAAAVAGIDGDPAYPDIRVVTASSGEIYLHSEDHLSANYARILLRAQEKNPHVAVAETVRDASRIYPRPTKCDLFREPAFGIPADDVDAVIAETLAKPENRDLRRMVHPETGAAYLYSSTFMSENQAFFIMDWDEVGAKNNP